MTVLCYRDFSENMQREVEHLPHAGRALDALAGVLQHCVESEAERYRRQGRRADSDRVKETLIGEAK